MNEIPKQKTMTSKQHLEGSNNTRDHHQEANAPAEFNQLLGRLLAQKWLAEQESSLANKAIDFPLN
jgi:hypothetical protein